MNKLTKAAIAGAAAIALLLGGAGSLALWNDSTGISAANITSGTLTVTEPSAGTWTTAAPALWVPGDSAVYTTTLTIGATGDNLEALLSVNPGSIGTGDLANALEFDIAIAAPLPAGVTAGATAGTYEITDAANGASLAVTVTVNFPANSVTGEDAQNETVDLSGMNFLLQQHL